MLKFFHWYINKAIDLEMYLVTPIFDIPRNDHTVFMVALLFIIDACCFLGAIGAGFGAISDEDSTAARIAIAAIVILIISPFVVATLPLLTSIAALLFILRLFIIAFELEGRLSLGILPDLYYKIRSRYLEFKSKRQAKKPIEKKDCAYRSNFCPVCSREYNK